MFVYRWHEEKAKSAESLIWLRQGNFKERKPTEKKPNKRNRSPAGETAMTNLQIEERHKDKVLHLKTVAVNLQ